MGWTLTAYDSSGRFVSSDSYAGNGLPSQFGGANQSTGTRTTTYSGLTSTSTDEARNIRTSTLDGLERLVGVTENNISHPHAQGVPDQIVCFRLPGTPDIVL